MGAVIAATGIPAVVGPVAASGQSTADVCAGATETLSWATAQPAGMIGYRIEDWVVTTATSGRAVQMDVGPSVTQTPVTILLGINEYQVWASTAADPYAQLVSSSLSGSNVGGQPPVPQSWSLFGSSVGDGTATVAFDWPAGVPQASLDGYLADTTLTVTGAGTTVAASAGTATVFSGLTDGQPYQFTGTTANACGSASQTSPVFIPGTPPVWTVDTPPQQVSAPGAYAYRFVASGKPKPSYSLIGAPSWLQIHDGLVSGVVPAGTTGFSYSVAAYNGVGIVGHYQTDPHVTVGPFVVTVSSQPTKVPTAYRLAWIHRRNR